MNSVILERGNMKFRIDYESSDGIEIDGISIYSAKTGEDLMDAVEPGTNAYNDCWDAADRDLIFNTGTSKQWLRAQRLDRLAQTYDTPFAEAA